MTLTFELVRAIVTEVPHTKFQVPMLNGSDFRAFTNRHTHTHTPTDGTDSITSTADAGGNKDLGLATVPDLCFIGLFSKPSTTTCIDHSTPALTLDPTRASILMHPDLRTDATKCMVVPSCWNFILIIYTIRLL